jgi:hypothetical protein
MAFDRHAAGKGEGTQRHEPTLLFIIDPSGNGFRHDLVVRYAELLYDRIESFRQRQRYARHECPFLHCGRLP